MEIKPVPCQHPTSPPPTVWFFSLTVSEHTRQESLGVSSKSNCGFSVLQSLLIQVSLQVWNCLKNYLKYIVQKAHEHFLTLHWLTCRYIRRLVDQRPSNHGLHELLGSHCYHKKQIWIENKLFEQTQGNRPDFYSRLHLYS